MPHDVPLPTAHAAPAWDLFCRVIDNRGDAGVGWRLARDLALRGQRVRLWIDRVEALDGMDDAADRQCVRRGAITVLRWPQDSDAWAVAPGTVAVVELFGCTLPDAVQRALARPDAPVWVNLEYLSAEGYVDRSHGLASPRPSGPAAGAVTWFFFPGFTHRTGGLLRAQTAAGDANSAFAPDADADPDAAVEGGGTAVTPPRWPPRREGDLRVSRFDYQPPQALPWLSGWAEDRPQGCIHLLLPGALGPALVAGAAGAAPEVHPALGPRLQWHPLPWLPQSGYDALLRGCDLNLVRGEDSFVRAQWAARPMLWQIYPQDDGAHAAKLEAWLDRYLDRADSALAAPVRHLHRCWNGLGPRGKGRDPTASALPSPFSALTPAVLDAWADHARRWRDALDRLPDLGSELLEFVARRRLQAQNAPGPTTSG